MLKEQLYDTLDSIQNLENEIAVSGEDISVTDVIQLWRKSIHDIIRTCKDRNRF